MLAEYEAAKDACEGHKLTTLLGMFTPSNLTANYATDNFAVVVEQEASKVKAKGLLGHYKFGWDYYSKETAYVQGSLIGALDSGYTTFLGNAIFNAATSGLNSDKTLNLGNYCDAPKIMHCTDMTKSLFDCIAQGMGAISFEPAVGVATSPPAGENYLAKLMKYRDGNGLPTVAAVSFGGDFLGCGPSVDSTCPPPPPPPRTLHPVPFLLADQVWPHLCIR